MKLKQPIPLLHPVPICLVGTMVNGKPNYTTIGDVAVAGIKPALIMISINAKHACMTFINQYKSFSINIPKTDQLNKVDYCGIYSGHDTDKSSLFSSDMIENIPIISDCPINLIVREIDRITVEHRVILICKVQETYVNDDIIKGGRLDCSKLSTVLYGLDNQYYLVGGDIGTGYHIGKTLTMK
jgi:flavin reductase (DIM6/NTAB) family NADH-FMN oxidoreductase RutF